jgi:nitric-oxide synthase
MKVGERANAELTGDTLEEARSFLALLRAERVIDTQTYRRRLDQIQLRGDSARSLLDGILGIGACLSVAWRQSSRCIGRLPWKTLIVRDCRELVPPEEIFGGCVDHLRLATNGGRIRPVMSIFAADRDQLHAMTTPALGSWARASCQPGSVRGGPDRSPGGLRARCTKHHADPRRWSTRTAPGYRERAESELNSPNHAGVGTTTVGPIRRKGSS